MPDQEECIQIGLVTPQGLLMICLTREGFDSLFQQVNIINQKLFTPVPKVFENAFKED